MRGANTTRGYVSAFDIDDRQAGAGASCPMPSDPGWGRKNIPTLEPRSRHGPEQPLDVGGAARPGAINYDPLTGYVLVGTGNGGPYAASKRTPKGGDNLYLGLDRRAGCEDRRDEVALSGDAGRQLGLTATPRR